MRGSTSRRMGIKRRSWSIEILVNQST
jgi:hypothetical protein